MKRSAATLISAWLLLYALTAAAHALLDHAVPGAGAILSRAPERVTVYFDSELEPMFSTLIVKDEHGAKISDGNGKVDARDPMALFTTLSRAVKGTCHVYWRVVSRDGHRTEGDYTFIVR